MPNGEDKRLNFTLKIWDATADAYRPVYIAPDATNTVQGDVKLSDATNSTLNAASGMTAATPAAVKAVADTAANKLDKVASADQTVASKVTFNNAVVGNKGITVPTGQYFTGNLSGNATTATTLQTARTIALTGRVTGSASFNGGANASIATTIAAGSITGTDIANNAITSAKIADGTITSADVGFNYAGSSSKGGAATSAVQLATARTISLAGDITGSTSFNGTANVSIATTLGAGVVGTNEIAANAVTSAKIADGTITAGDVGFNYALGATKGGNAVMANDLRTVQSITSSIDWNTLTNTGQYLVAMETLAGTNIPTGAYGYGTLLAFKNSGNHVAQIYLPHKAGGVIYYRYLFSGSSWTTWSAIGNVPDGSITTAKLADNAVTTAKLSNNSVTSAKIVDGTIVAADIADTTITGAKLVNSTITGGKIASNTITATNIANSTITNAKMAANSVNSSNIVDGTVTGADLAANTVTLNNLASDVGTVAVQSTEPTDSNVKIWVQI